MEEKSEASTKEDSSGFLDMIPTFSKFLGPPFIVKKSFVCIVVRSFLVEQYVFSWTMGCTHYLLCCPAKSIYTDHKSQWVKNS